MHISSFLLLLTLTGVVRDEVGRPVGGAKVVVRPDPTEHFEQFDVVETDAAGRFRIELEEGTGKVSVGVFADRFVPLQEASVDAGATLELVLTRGATVEGVVVDARSRDPIPGAVVEKRIHARAIAPPGLPLLGTARASTDARGAFRLEGILSPSGTLSAAAPGYGRTEAEVRSDGTPVVVALSPGGVGIYGRVLGSDGEPVQDAYVGAQSYGNERAWMVESPLWSSTDAEGRFALLGIDRGRHVVIVRPPDDAFLLRTVEVGEGDVVLDDLRVARGGGLTGVLTDSEGRPVEGAVRVKTIDGERPPLPLYDRMLAQAEDGSRGRFSLDGLPPGDYELSASASGFAEREVSPFEVASGEVTDIGDVVLGEGFSLAGVVTDPDGEPVPGARVVVWQHRDSRWFRFEEGSNASTESAADGTFAMAGLAAGRYRLGASAPGHFGADEIEVEAGERDIVIVLAPTGGVTGSVVDPEGVSVLDFTMAIAPLDRRSRNRGTFEIPSNPAEGGRFAFEALEPGTYRLGSLAPGFKPERLDDVVVTAGVTHDVGTLVLKPGGTIRGIVVDEAGEPVASAELALNPGHGGRTDAEGRFDIRGLEVGVIDVRVTHPDFAHKTLRDVELRSEAIPVELRIELGRGGAVEGIVRDRDGVGLAGRRLRYRGAGARQRQDVTTDFDGTFRVERLEEGLYRFELMSSNASVETAVQTVEVEVESGELARVELVSSEILVSGQVSKRNVAVAGAHLSLRPKGGGTGFGYVVGEDVDFGGPLPMNALTGPDGFYELYVEAPGEYDVLLSAADGTSFPRKSVFVPDVTSHSADLEWGTVLLEGRVVSEESGEPVADARLRVYPLTTGPVANVSAYASTDLAGAFQLELEPGEYRFRTAADGYGLEETPVSITEHGVRSLRIVLGRGGVIRGVVMDANGNHPGRYFVHAVLDSGTSLDPPVFSDWAEVHVDGTFEFRDLSPGRYNVLAGTDLVGFAFAPGVTPGEEITLRLRPAAWVDVTVRGSDGAPVAGAQVVVSALQGYKVRGVSGRTDVVGAVALYAPAGALELKAVSGDELVSAISITVRPGERASVDMPLQRVRVR